MISLHQFDFFLSPSFSLSLSEYFKNVSHSRVEGRTLSLMLGIGSCVSFTPYLRMSWLLSLWYFLVSVECTWRREGWVGGGWGERTAGTPRDNCFS